MIIAQQFTAGLSVSILTDLSPIGTIENEQVAKLKLIASVVPTGLKTEMRPRLPSDKSLGYSQISLREKNLMNFILCNSSAKGQICRDAWWHRRLACAVSKVFSPAPARRRCHDCRLSILFLVLVASFGCSVTFL